MTTNTFEASSVIKILRALQTSSTLLKLVISNSNIGSEAADDITAVLSHNTDIQVFRIDNNNMDTMGALKITRALPSSISTFYISVKSKHIRDYIHDIKIDNAFNLSIKGNYTSPANTTRSEHHFSSQNVSNNDSDSVVVNDIEIVPHFSHKLKICSLYGTNFKITVILKIMKAFMCNTSSLVSISISGNNISIESADYIADVISRNTALSKFCFYKNTSNISSTIKIVKALQGISSLKIFNVSSSDIGSEVARYIADTISRSTKLSELHIQENNIGSSGAISIALGLQNTRSLTELNIANNNINSEAADNIATVIWYNRIKKIFIQNNSLETNGTIKIAKALQNLSTTLTYFDISNNNVGCEAADDIAIVLSSNTALRSVSIQENKLGSSGAIKIAKGLQNITSLWYFNISSNYIGSEAADDIAAVLSRNTNIVEFKMDNNNINTTAAMKITRALQFNRYLLTFYVLVNNTGSKEVNDIKVNYDRHQSSYSLSIKRNYTRSVNTTLHKCHSTFLYISSDDNEVIDDIEIVPYCSHKLRECSLYEINFNITAVFKIAKAFIHSTPSFTSIDISKNIISSDAADYIAGVISHNTALQKFYFHKNTLSTSSAIKVIKALQNTSTIKLLSVSNNIGGIADNIAVVLSYNKHLQSLYVQENNFQTSGAIKIARALQDASTLTNFNISSNNISSEVADEIAVVLSCNTLLRRFVICNNSLRTSGAIKIAKALLNTSTLVHFDISNNNVGSAAADDIAAFMCHNFNLKIVRIGRNNLETSGIVKIAKSLQNISSLTEFSISSNNIDSEAADDIATVVSHNTALKVFYVDNNNLETVGTIKIARALKNISTLVDFNISKNSIGNEAADDIVAALSHNSELEKFYIQGNNLETAGAIKITRGVLNTLSLTKLDLSSNNINSEAADDIAAFISCSTRLKEFYIQENNLEISGAVKIARALQNISTLKKFGILKRIFDHDTTNDIETVLSNIERFEIDI